MNLATLLLSLKPLIDDPQANWDKIAALLSMHSDRAEYEVARFYVSRPMLPVLAQLSRSPDPRERRRAAETIRLLCTKDTGAKLLRALVKDADLGVRSRARRAVRALGLADVALPDARVLPPEEGGALAIGGWNPTGWAFGLFKYQLGYSGRGRPRLPPREAQLLQQGLPVLRSVPELLALLGLKKPAELRRLLRPGSATGSPYVEFSIAKATGGERRISAPRARLKRVQQVILREILARLVGHEACHGFVPRRSVVSNARPHEGAEIVVKLDLRDFFPTIHYRRVQGLFLSYGYSEEVAAVLAGLTTHRPALPDGTVVWPGVLPQGAPTSPALANLVCRRLDARLSGLAERVGARYTRYADDLTFSFQSPPIDGDKGLGRFLWWAEQICHQEGFIENTAKRRVLRRKSQQRITGVVVNNGLRVPREARRRFRAILANCRKHGVESQARERKDFRGYLLGFAAYVRMVQPELGQRLMKEVKAVLSLSKDPGGGPSGPAGGA